jgi:hypothetical protein
MALAAFNAGLQAARERMVWTDPGSLSAASVARTRGGSNPPSCDDGYSRAVSWLMPAVLVIVRSRRLSGIIHITATLA